jgi:hypothetical protein
MERDGEKTLQGPTSDGLSMSTAAKTTPSVRLKLKEAQEEIGELRLALAKQKAAPSQTSDETPEDTPEETTKEWQMNINNNDNKTQNIRKALIEHLIEAQAIGSALAQKHRSAMEIDNDAMEEDVPPPQDTAIAISSRESTSSSSSSLSSLSSLSSSSSSKSNDDADSEMTQDLTARLQMNNAKKITI